MHALLGKPAHRLRDVGLVGERGIGIGRAAPGLELAHGRAVTGTGRSVHVVEVLRAHVVGLDVGVAEGPRGRDAAGVRRLLEVALAQARKRGAVDLGVAANDVVHAGCERRAVDGIPRVVRLVAPVDEDRLRRGVLRLLGQAMTALEHEDIHAALRQAVGERRPAHAAADDDDVSGEVHGPIPPRWAPRSRRRRRATRWPSPLPPGRAPPRRTPPPPSSHRPHPSTPGRSRSGRPGPPAW